MRLRNASALCKYEGMRLSLRGVVILIAGLALVQGVVAQTSAPKPATATRPAAKRFCQAEGVFCFSYPANWQVLSESFGDGAIVAPQQKGERALWDEVTVATVVAAPGEGQSAHSIDDVIATALSNMQADGRNPQTLQRQQRTVDGLPAQMIKLQYHDDEGHNWIEELVFIEGPEQEIYSLAMKAQPANIARVEPGFEGILRSWRLRAQHAASSPPSSEAPGKAPSSTFPPPKN